MQTIIPILRYQDARSAIRWLCAAFGFVEEFSVPESGEPVRHARLRLGTNVIMLGTSRPGEALASPLSLGFATQALCVQVENVEAHFQRAQESGATITSTPHATDFGAREYHVMDLEGHPWTFSSRLPEPGATQGSLMPPAWTP